MFVRMQYVVVFVCLIIGYCTTGVQAAEQKIGVMNVQKVIALSDAGKAAQSRMEQKAKDFQAKFKSDDDSFKALQQDIEKKGSAWNEEKKAEKARELQKMKRELQAKADEARFDLKQQQDKELEPILKALEGVVDKLGKENGYSIILDTRSGLYFDKAIDVSETVVKQLNAAMAKK